MSSQKNSSAIILFAFGILFLLSPSYVYAGLFNEDWPDAISCVTSGVTHTHYLSYNEATSDFEYTELSIQGTISFDSAREVQFEDSPCTGIAGDSIDSVSFIQYDFGGEAATSTPSETATTTTPYAPTQQEFLFLIAVILFIGSVPFWERALGNVLKTEV